MTVSTVYNNLDSAVALRVTRDAAVLPQTAAGALFTISGGRVYLFAIVGEVTVEIGAGANSAKLIHNPTVGSDTDLCVALDIDGDTVGTVYSITGTVTDAMAANANGFGTLQASVLALSAGTIDLDCTASKAGEVKWTLFYCALDEGAKIVAA
jgi:hypothetical protein